MPFGTIRNPLTVGASGQSDGSAYRALAESLAQQQGQAGPSSGLNALNAVLGVLAQQTNLNRASEADQAYEARRMKQYEEFQTRQADEERARATAAGTESRKALEQQADQIGLQGAARVAFINSGGKVPDSVLNPKQADPYDAWLAQLPPDKQAQAFQVKAGLAPRAQAPSQGGADRELSFQEYQSLPDDQKAAYDAYKGRGSSTVGQSVNQQKQDQAVAQKMAQFKTLNSQLDRLEGASTAIAKNSVFNGGPLDKYALDKMPEGQEMQQAATSILPVLTALTRTPGLGSQSDFEARLAQLQLPSTEFPPEVNARAMQGIRQYAADLEAALRSTTGGGQPQQQAAPAGGDGWSIEPL